MREYWTDHLARQWIVPQIKGRLRFRIPSHQALREFVLHRDGHRCRRCGSSDRPVPDHILSRRNGGRHHPDNLQCLCSSCNSRKANVEDSKVGR